jgi:hypothetical protein
MKGLNGSNPPLSATQSFSSRTSQRTARNPRVRARFVIAHGPRERARGALIAETRQNLSGLDSTGSMDVRSEFAFIDRNRPKEYTREHTPRDLRLDVGFWASCAASEIIGGH